MSQPQLMVNALLISLAMWTVIVIR